MYFIFDQAADGVDYFYAGSEPDEDDVLVHYWVTDVLSAAMYATAQYATQVVDDELDDPNLIVAALPESLSAFLVERHNYSETLHRVEQQAANFIEQVNAFARAIQGPGGAHQGPGGAHQGPGGAHQGPGGEQ